MGTVLAIVASFGMGGFGAAPLPSHQHFEALARLEDCQIYRAVLQQAKTYVQQAQAEGVIRRAEVEERWQELERCAREKKLPSGVPVNSEREILFGLLCPDQYRSWLVPGAELEELRDQIAKAKAQEESIQRQVQRSCLGIQQVADAVR